MNDIVVDRLIVRCTDDGDGKGALRARAVLDDVAAHHLPDRLDKGLGRFDGDVEIPHITVRLDFDPRDYDDMTVAVLWADRIRAALDALLPSTVDDGRGTDAAVDPPPSTAEARPDVDRADGAGRAEEGAIRPLTALADAELRSAILALSDEQLGAEVAALSLQEREQLLARLTDVVRDGSRGSAQSPNPAIDRTPPLDATIAGREPREPATTDELAGLVAALRDASAAIADAPDQGTTTRMHQRSSEQENRPSDSATHERGGGPARGRRSPAGGLVLLWPWLAAFVQRVQLPADEGELLAVPQRAWALSRLAREIPGATTEDPLVMLLAGGQPGRPLSPWAPPPQQVPAIDAAADQVLSLFVGLLPGFAESSPSFVAAELLTRASQFDDPIDVVPTQVRLAPRPLDVLIDRLPYPLGLFQLPWTAPITIDLERQ